jgi:hypothetical protein
MPQQPKSLMGRNQAFRSPPLAARRKVRIPADYELQHIQQLPCNLDLALVAGVMECD